MFLFKTNKYYDQKLFLIEYNEKKMVFSPVAPGGNEGKLWHTRRMTSLIW